jgi:hypothetical protein
VHLKGAAMPSRQRRLFNPSASLRRALLTAAAAHKLSATSLPGIRRRPMEVPAWSGAATACALSRWLRAAQLAVGSSERLCGATVLQTNTLAWACHSRLLV